jgi:integrase
MLKKRFPQRAGKQALPNFTFHDLRHTFGTRLADAGVDVVKIKELSGTCVDCDNDALHPRD